MEMIKQPLGHNITCLDAQYVHPGIASIYLLEQDAKLCIIETGTAHSVPYILAALEAQGRSAEDVEYVIPTHIHLDHAGGAGELMQHCPNAKLVVHPRGAYHMAHPEKLQAGTMAVYGEETFRQLYGTLTPIAEERIIQAEDNHEIDFHGRILRFMDTPGHALHHFCVLDSLSKGIFTGDTFGLSYRQFDEGGRNFVFATTTPVHFDPDALLSSIDKLLALKPRQMYLTHYCAIQTSQENIAQLKKSVQAFVEIALAAKNSGENRQRLIEQQLLEWIVKESYRINNTLSESERRRIVATDARLNAQGLEVWLNRLEPKARGV